MRSKLLIGLVALSLVLAAPVLAGPEKAKAGDKEAQYKAEQAKKMKKKECTHDTQACLNKMLTAYEKKGWVGIEMDHDKTTEGWVITKVEPNSPALEAGLQKGDVLLAVNGLEYGSEDKAAWKKVKHSMTIGSTITYTVKRGNHKKQVDVTLAKIPGDVMAKWIGRHMQEHGTIELAQKD
jgi:predicted metalloprotease with PDZ domain